MSGLQLSEIPDAPDEGTERIEAGDAFWVPVGCVEHDGAFQPLCPGCQGTWKGTRDAMVRVAMSNLQAGL